MRTLRRPCTRTLALLLGVQLAFPAWAWPGDGVASLGVLRPHPLSPSGAAVWDRAAAALDRDTTLVLLHHDEVRARLVDWASEGAAIRRGREVAAEAWGGRVRGTVDRAWADYYAFDFERAQAALEEADGLLDRLGASGLQAKALHEIRLLQGMALRAAGKDPQRAAASFAAAAAVLPGAELPEVRYSPAVREEFARARSVALAGERGRLVVEGIPQGAEVLVDGSPVEAPPSGIEVLPGTHFVEVRLSGRRTFLQRGEASPWDVRRIRADLPLEGPDGEPGEHLPSRFLAEDREALAAAVHRVGVDRLILGRESGGRLEAWLVDGEGRTVAGAVLADAASAAPRDPSALLGLVAEALPGKGEGRERLSLDAVAVPSTSDGWGSEVEDEIETSRRWPWLLAGLALAALVASQSERERDVTRVEVSW